MAASTASELRKERDQLFQTAGNLAGTLSIALQQELNDGLRVLIDKILQKRAEGERGPR